MSESNDERLDRKKRERREYLKQQAEDKALADKLDNDPQFAKDFDESFVRGFTGIEDDVVKKFAEAQGYSKAEIEAMHRTVKRARQAAKGGFLSSGNPEEAEKILMSNRGIREMRKSKEDKSCFIASILLLMILGSTVGAALWGAVEIVSALS